MTNHDWSTLVLAAGKGTRLGELSHSKPKPILPFFGKPILDWVFDMLSQLPDQPVYVNTHYLAKDIETFITSKPYSRNTNLVYECEILGTGGAIANILKKYPIKSLAVINGDIIANINLDAIVDKHMSLDADATMLCLESTSPDENQVVVDSNSNILGFKPYNPQKKINYGFACIQYLGPRFLELFRKRAGFFSVIDVYKEAIHLGLIVKAQVYNNLWFDLGTPKRYLDAHIHTLKALSQGADSLNLTKRLNSQFDLYMAPSTQVCSKKQTETVVLGPSIIHKDVYIGKKSVIGPNVFLGTRCSIPNNSQLKNTVIDGSGQQNLVSFSKSLILDRSILIAQHSPRLLDC